MALSSLSKNLFLTDWQRAKKRQRQVTRPRSVYRYSRGESCAKQRGYEAKRHLSGSFCRFLSCLPCLAPARLRHSHQKPIKNFSLRCACSFQPLAFLKTRKITQEISVDIFKGFSAVLGKARSAENPLGLVSSLLGSKCLAKQVVLNAPRLLWAATPLTSVGGKGF